MSPLNGTPHGPWIIQKSQNVYQDPWLSVRQDIVIRPDGHPGTHSVVSIKSGVCVLAFQGDTIYLTEEFHYAVGRVTLEAVSGGIEQGEPAMECAKRELAEELGITAGSWYAIGMVDPFTASVVSPTQLFLATDLTFHDDAPEGTELITRIAMPMTEVLAAVYDGRITHAPTCVAILRHALQVFGQPCV